MFDLLRSFLVTCEVATTMVEVNIAAGRARQELDQLMLSPSALLELRTQTDVLLRRTGYAKLALPAGGGTSRAN